MAASIKCDERPFRGGLGGLCPPSQKLGGLGGSAPQPKIFRKFSKKINIFCFSGYGHRGVVIGAGDWDRLAATKASLQLFQMQGVPFAEGEIDALVTKLGMWAYVYVGL